MTTALPPGSTIGILGGGQLGRMLALAGARLGLRSHIFAPEEDSPAFDVTRWHTRAGYRDEAALETFARSVSAVTLEFENIPVGTVEFLSRLVPVRPGAKALRCAQDRLNEKALARELGAMTADFAVIDSLADLERALAGPLEAPAVLKTRRFGYDGKGQAKVMRREDAAAAWAAIGGKPGAILEAFVPFEREVSVVAARGIDGGFSAFDVTENEHRNHILHRSVAPARISEATGRMGVDTARRMAEALDYVGVFAIEYFVTGSGAGERLLVNEMAPRVHNSGHWTIEGSDTSQFEQHMRAVAGWPLGSTRRRAPAVEMINLIGDEMGEWTRIAADAGAQLQHYGKAEARAGRKMGHVTRLLG
jgi:5-(carboxyamino)imidazole ribonucleotide synthase